MKTFKKIAVMIIAAAMVFGMFTALGTAQTKADEGIVAGLICLHDENSTYDLNFINAFKEACEARGLVEGETYYISTNIPEGQECYEEAMNMVDRGCNVVFADSFGHEDYMIEAAKEAPEVHFCHATGTKAHTENLPNYHNAFASIYEGRFMAGIAAGMKLNEMIAEGKITEEEAKMGYVGAFTYAEVISGYTSFFLGARSVCPSATMEVTFTGSWYDETKEKEGAQMLINDGCVLISQHADSMGAPTACEAAGVPDVSYNGSTIAAAPNTYIISSRINWAPYYTFVMDSIEAGAEIPADWTGTIETESVLLTDLNDAVAAEGTAEAIEEAKAKLLAGELQVFDASTFTVEGAALETYMADVDTDPAYEGDTEVVIDGAFLESNFRSAPYFDLQIDGITLLDTAF
ncbi:MAG: BMP family ABC transporter substrate-binding protein [Parasporobacterium sp.]|nr:BMP family ABC transporter substrate-binding protein [Parasporobacterium sp.]